MRSSFLLRVGGLRVGASARRSLSSDAKLRCAMLNAARLDYDGRINFDKLASIADVSRHEVSDHSQVLQRVEGHSIVLNKEMPLPGDLIRAFPPSVKLICEVSAHLPLHLCRRCS